MRYAFFCLYLDEVAGGITHINGWDYGMCIRLQADTRASLADLPVATYFFECNSGSLVKDIAASKSKPLVAAKSMA